MSYRSETLTFDSLTFSKCWHKFMDALIIFIGQSLLTDFDGIEVKTHMEFNKADTQLEGGEEMQSELKGPMVGVLCTCLFWLLRLTILHLLGMPNDHCGFTDYLLNLYCHRSILCTFLEEILVQCCFMKVCQFGLVVITQVCYRSGLGLILGTDT